MEDNAPRFAPVRNWFLDYQACIRAADYDRAEKMLAPDVLCFGTFTGVLLGTRQLRTEQWEQMWPRIRDFTFQLDELHGSVEGEVAWAACPWRSLGIQPDDTEFSRRGRVTVVLERQNGAWVGIHTHFSLYPR